ncbi:MAG: cytochrome C assembly protein, partial [Psychrobacter sp.]|nr:cytochrome C assembly protein [Psychrobacter sp.]
MLLAFMIASIAYIAVTLYIGWALTTNKTIHKGASLGLLLVGMLAHAALLYPYIFTLYGLNFNLFNVFSLISLFFLFFYVLFSLYRSIVSLGILAAPTALLGMTTG